MSFDFVNASVIFQAYVNKTLIEIINIFCVVYLNDILIFSKNKKKYVFHVRDIFTRRNGVGWVGFWDQKPNPRKVWVGRVGFEFGVGWIGFFFELPIVTTYAKKSYAYAFIHIYIEIFINS